VLGNWTGIPVFKLTEAETTRLLAWKSELHKRIIGQDDAVKALSQAIRRTRAGLKDPKRPGGSFIFAGPTGVGKTELAKALAEFLFGDEDALIHRRHGRVPREAHGVAAVRCPSGLRRLRRGRPAHREGAPQAVLRRAVRRDREGPPDIFNTLLQVLEDGRLTDAQGRTVDFKNTVIILTTNLGTRDISKAVGLGFTQGKDIGENNYERMKQKVNDELKKHFRPEFLNRIDDVVVFHQLTRTRSSRWST
jgi:ATP-dependent Clp protease ATP-binding subunit ClpC